MCLSLNRLFIRYVQGESVGLSPVLNQEDRLKKFIKIFLVIFALGTVHVGAAEIVDSMEFTDLSESYWAYDGIAKLIKAGIIDGYPDGTFKPDGNITRAELVKILNQVFLFKEKQETSMFSDVTESDWFYEYVMAAQEAGYVDGYPDGTFKPNGLITRQEFCKMLAEINNFTELAYDSYPDDEISQWAVEYVRKVVSNRIMLPDSEGRFRALDNVTRAEVCDALAKFIIVNDPVDGETNSSFSGGSGTNGSGNNTQEDMDDIMNRVVRRLELGVIPNLTTEGQKEIINDITINMNEYMEDNSHDYKIAAKETYAKYKLLSAEERDGLKSEVLKQNAMADLLQLQVFFFPDKEL